MYQSMQRGESSLDLALADREHLTIGDYFLQLTWRSPFEWRKE
jgi:hypothetical protein